MNKPLLVSFLVFCSMQLSLAQPMVLQRGSEKFPVRELPDGGRSVTIDGRTYFLVSKEDLSALSAESEVLRAVVNKNDTLFAKHDALLSRYARYEEAAESLVTRQQMQIQQSEAITHAYHDVYEDLKRMAGISPWSLSAGIGVQSFDSDARMMASLGIGYQHWVAQYQFASKYNGVLVGFRLIL